MYENTKIRPNINAPGVIKISNEIVNDRVAGVRSSRPRAAILRNVPVYTGLARALTISVQIRNG